MLKKVLSWLDISFEDGELKSYLLKAGSGSFIGMIVALVLTFITSIVLARSLGPEQYGVYAFIISLILVFSHLALLGYDSLISREMAKYRSLNERFKSNALFRFGLSKVLPLSILFVLALVFGSSFFPILENLSINEKLFAFSAIPFVVIMLYFTSSLHGNQHVLSAIFPERVVRPTFFLVVLLIIFYGFKTLTLYQVFVFSTIGYLVAAAVAFISLQKKEPSFTNLKETVLVSPIQKIDWRKGAYLFFVLNAVEWITKKIDVLMIGNMLPAEELGIYHISLKLAEFMLIPMIVINIVAAPKIAAYFAQNQLTEIKNFSIRITRLVLFGSIAIFLLLFVFGGTVIKIYGIEYQRAYVPMIIVATAFLLQIICGIGGLILLMTKHVKRVVRATLIALVIYVISYLILIPKFGIIGAAAAYGIGLLFLKIIMYVDVVKHFGFHIHPFVQIDK